MATLHTRHDESALFVLMKVTLFALAQVARSWETRSKARVICPNLPRYTHRFSQSSNPSNKKSVRVCVCGVCVCVCMYVCMYVGMYVFVNDCILAASHCNLICAFTLYCPNSSQSLNYRKRKIFSALAMTSQLTLACCNSLLSWPLPRSYPLQVCVVLVALTEVHSFLQPPSCVHNLKTTWTMSLKASEKRRNLPSLRAFIFPT